MVYLCRTHRIALYYCRVLVLRRLIHNNVSSPTNPSSLRLQHYFSLPASWTLLTTLSKSPKSQQLWHPPTSCHHPKSPWDSSLTPSLESPSNTFPLSFHLTFPVIRINALLTEGTWYRGENMRLKC